MNIQVLLITDASSRQNDSANFEHKKSVAFFWKSKYISRGGFQSCSKFESGDDVVEAEGLGVLKGIESINSFFSAALQYIKCGDFTGFNKFIARNKNFDARLFLKDASKSDGKLIIDYAVACDNFFFVQDLILFDNKRGLVISKYFDVGDEIRKARSIRTIANSARLIYKNLLGKVFLYSPKEFQDEIKTMHNELHHLCKFIIRGYVPKEDCVFDVLNRVGGKIQIHKKMCE